MTTNKNEKNKRIYLSCFFYLIIFIRFVTFLQIKRKNKYEAILLCITKNNK